MADDASGPSAGGPPGASRAAGAPPTGGPSRAPGASLAAMYQDALLAHHRAPHNKRDVADATGRATLRNPVCGDTLTVAVRVVGEVITDVAFTGQACSIASASASLMTGAVGGRSVAEALVIAEALEAMLMGAEAVTLPTSLDPLRGVAPFTGRHGCARMAWTALREALG